MLMLGVMVLVGCTDNIDAPVNPVEEAVDEGPSYTEKTVDVNRDGKAYGQVTLRFYADMPNVPYISVADFHKVMTGGQTMKVQRQGNLYELTTLDDKVLVSTALDMYTINKLDPDFAAKPYQQTEVTADMAKYRYQELCFVFDNLFGYPGRSPMEQNGMGEKGFDATLDVVENGPVIKRLLQSPNNMDFAWGRMALQYLVHDGGHTNVRATAGVPDKISADYVQRMLAVEANYPEASAMFEKNVKELNERSKVMTQLAELRRQAYGDVLYKANSQKTLGVIIINSFADQDEKAWNKYYASPKGDSDWQELMQNYEKDNCIAFLYALGQAKKDGVKNLIVDVTQNGGGSCDIVAATVAMLRKNRTVQFWSQDALEGTNKITTYQIDTNFDGVFDERDDTYPKFDCSDMNIAVLSSWLSFSCAHQFTTLMKDYDFPIIGEHSGGGTCCIQVMLTPDGQHYMISTYRDRSTDKNFANTDSGIPTNGGYAFDYAHFYDLDYLTTKMQELYVNK